MSDAKNVDSVTSFKADRLRYTLQGSGASLTSYTWVLTGQTAVTCHDNLKIVAGGYNSSFERKLKESGNGLVTGTLRVEAFWDKLIPGSHTRVVRNTYFGTYGGETTSFFPHMNPPGNPPSLLTDAKNAALKRLLKKYLDNRKVLAAVIAAELGSSMDSVKQGFAAARDLFRSSHNRVLRFFKKEDRRLSYRERRRRKRGLNPRLPAKEVKRSLKRCLNRLSKEWLNISFGLSPLLSDLEGINTISYMQRKRQPPMKLRAVDFRGSSSAPMEESIGCYGDTVTCQAITTTKATVKLLSMLRVGKTALYQQALGLEARDIPSTIWELLPYSWLVDYFTNASQMIEHYSHFTGIPSETQETTIVESATKFTFRCLPAPDSATTVTVSRSFTPSKRTRGTRVVERRATSGIPGPSFHGKVPTHSIQQANLAALAWVKASKVELGDALMRIIRHA